MQRTIRILLVEDTAADIELILEQLKNSGLPFIPTTAQNRKEFLSALESFQPDLILADYHLPHFGAIEAMSLLKERHSKVPLILVTGSQSEEVAVQCMHAGAKDYILKQSLKRLPAAVENVLRQAENELSRLAAEAALRDSEELFRLIAENTRDLIWVLDLELNCLYASPSFLSVLGREPKGIIGGRVAHLIQDEDAPIMQRRLNEVLTSQKLQTFELRLKHANGTWHSFETRLNCTFDPDGKPQRILMVCNDNSDRKRAEKEILKLASFPRFNPNPIFEFSPQGDLTYFNDAAMEMARSLKKTHPQAILPLNTVTKVRRCYATGQKHHHIDASIAGRTLSWSFFPILSNQVVHCYAEDITENVNLEAQLRQSQKMDSIGQLAAGVAHDFNNILTVIQGHASMMLKTAEERTELCDSARQIVAASERATNLTRQLLMFSRKQTMQPQMLNLNEVVAEVTKMLRTLLGEQIRIERVATSDLPPIYADQGMMEQVLINLAVNARDAMGKGGTITIKTGTVELESSPAPAPSEARTGHFVVLTVSDTGHGMDSETLNRIFEPFFTTKDIGHGTGLGLATAYGIVKQHQGWIEVQSKVNEGTTFNIYLPATAGVGRAEAEPQTTGAPGGKETILVVEDEPALRELVQEILLSKGYSVMGAASGARALVVWAEHKDKIDLVLTDMMMPEGVSGRDLAEKVQRDRADIKVIYTSGYSLDVVSPDFTLKEGINYLQKPYMPDTLIQLVRNVLDGKPTGK